MKKLMKVKPTKSLFYILGIMTGACLVLIYNSVISYINSSKPIPEPEISTFYSERAGFSFKHSKDFPVVPLSDLTVYQFDYIEWINLGTTDVTPNASSDHSGTIIVSRIPCVLPDYEEIILKEYKDLIEGLKKTNKQAYLELPTIEKTKVGYEDAYIVGTKPELIGTFDNTKYEVNFFTPCLRYQIIVSPTNPNTNEQMKELLSTFKFGKY